jgi:DNA polymerase I
MNLFVVIFVEQKSNMHTNSLSDLFADEEKVNVEDKKKVLLFDSNNLAWRTVFTAVHFNPEDNEKFFFFRYLFLNNIFQNIKKFKPSKVVLSFDARNSWRYEVFSGYKQNRKQAREKSVIDFEKFYPVLDTFKADIKETFSNIYLLQIPRCESDDSLAVLAKQCFTEKDDVIIISNDGDMRQLITKNVQVYDPMKASFVKGINPKQELLIKILSGDKSDNIPGIKKRLGKKTATKIIDNGLEMFLESSDAITKDNYERNKKLVDLNCIPEDVKNSIVESFNKYSLSSLDIKKVISFFVKHKLKKMMDTWQEYSEYLKEIK